MVGDNRTQDDKADKPSITLPGVVEKIIPAVPPVVPEKAQISVEGADHLYKEIRVDNALEDKDGKKVKLKPGAEVEVTIEADKSAIDTKEQPKNP
jgi:hypothetical protein